MIENNLSLKDRFRLWKLGVMASIPEALLFCNAVVAQAQEETEASGSGTNITARIDSASTSMWSVLKTVCISMLVVVLAVCGLILILGTQKMKEGVKEHFYSIVIGCMILFLAKDIAEYMEKTFN